VRIPVFELVSACCGESKAEARRLVSQGAITYSGSRITDPLQEIDLGSDEQILRVGKRKFFRVKRDTGE
jgi:tyrosyl-tRNA synthetase